VARCSRPHYKKAHEEILSHAAELLDVDGRFHSTPVLPKEIGSTQPPSEESYE